MDLPSTFGSVVAFLFFIAPGVLWNQLRRNWKTPAERSTFQEMSVVALFGTTFSILSTALTLVVADQIKPSYYARLQRLLAGTDSIAKTGFALPAILALIELAGASALVVLAFLLLRSRFYGAEKPARTAWQTILVDQRPENSVVIGAARLANGSELSGLIVGHNSAGPLENRYLILGQPIAVRIDPSAAAPPQPLPYARMVLSADQVQSLAVDYMSP